MATKVLLANAAALLLAGAAALRSRQPAELAPPAAELEATDDDDAIDIDWAVSQIMDKLRPPQPQSDSALQRAGSVFGTDRTPKAWIFGAHHKAGTDLLRQVAVVQATQVRSSTCLSYGKYGWGPRGCDQHYKDYNTWFYYDLTAGMAQGGFGIKERGLAYRTVHIIRDPLAMVVSGYIFHSKSDDTPPELQKERNQSMIDGLATEANFVLQRSGQSMLDTFLATRGDPRVLNVRFEDFTRSSPSFEATARKLYDFTVGGILEDYSKDMGTMLEKISHEDLLRFPKTKSKHVAKRTDEARVKTALMSIPANLRADLELMRTRLGY